jgi:hypothetical protein
MKLVNLIKASSTCKLKKAQVKAKKKDYYYILDIPKSASETEIKKIIRKQLSSGILIKNS